MELPQLMSQRMRISKMALHQNVFGEVQGSKSHRAVIRIKFFQLLTRTNPAVDLNTTQCLKYSTNSFQQLTSESWLTEI